MPPDLPHLLEPERLAKRGETITGHYAIPDLERLQGLLYDPSGTVHFRLEFSHDKDKRQSYIRGMLQADLHLVCQRCLGCLPYTIDSRFILGITQEDTRLTEWPDDCEILPVGQEPVLLAVLIEDELILALPITAMHAESDCPVAAGTSQLNDDQRVDEKPGPFADLKKMIRNSTN